MNRRGFLQAILAAGVAPAIVGSGILMPVRALVRPEQLELVPVGVGTDFVRLRALPAGTVVGNQLITISAITREALMVLERELVDMRRLNDDYLNGFMRKGDDLIVRRPERFVPFAA